MKIKPSEVPVGRYVTDQNGDMAKCIYPGVFALHVRRQFFVATAHPPEPLELLPEACTSFDWQPEPEPEPIDPGPGHRLLAKGERVLRGDEVDMGYGWEPSLNHHDGPQSTSYPYRRRIATTTRPFASAEEYAPHRDRWVRAKHWEKGCSARVIAVAPNELGVGDDFLTYEGMYQDFVFDDDGTPFGITNTPETT